jgi:diguanylate cyclase (GGDEF)-like protein
MTLVLGCWVLAMVSGLCWARPYTVLFVSATLLAWLWRDGSTLTTWSGWLQLASLGLTPWVLAAQRRREQEVLRALHAEEAVQMSHVSDSARELLSLQRATQGMETQIADITDLYHVTKGTSGALHLKELFAASLDIAPRLLSARGLWLIDLSGETPQVLRAARATDGRLIPTADTGGVAVSEASPPHQGGTSHVQELERAIVREALSSRQPGSATAQTLGCPFPPGVSRLSWAILWREQRPTGILVAEELPEPQLRTLSIVANQLALQCSRVHLYQQVEALAVTDALTGLSVRSHFLERAREELARSKRHGLSCTLLMGDLDHFKQKNDTFGHLVGDVVLREVARLLQRNLREIDLIARFGGEEFILLLIETALGQAMPIAERLKQLVEIHPIHAYDERLTQTISFGVAAFPEHADTLELLMERADQALYAAKRAGRNRVVQWSETLVPA